MESITAPYCCYSLPHTMQNKPLFAPCLPNAHTLHLAMFFWSPTGRKLHLTDSIPRPVFQIPERSLCLLSAHGIMLTQSLSVLSSMMGCSSCCLCDALSSFAGRILVLSLQCCVLPAGGQCEAAIAGRESQHGSLLDPRAPAPAVPHLGISLLHTHGTHCSTRLMSWCGSIC